MTQICLLCYDTLLSLGVATKTFEGTCCLCLTGCYLKLEDGGSNFPRNAGKHPESHMMSSHHDLNSYSHGHLKSRMDFTFLHLPPKRISDKGRKY